MPRKQFTSEQITQNLREAEVLLSQDKTIAQVCKKIGVTDRPTTAGGRNAAGCEPTK